MLRRNKSQILKADTRAGAADSTPVTGRADPGRGGLIVHGGNQRGEAGTGAREPFTYVHHGTVVIGEVIATGRVRVHGEVRGDVKVDGVLEVAESGSVTGVSVSAHVVKVLGRVTADVVASSKVEIWKGGVLTGNVTAPALDIEEGATFNGFSHMVAGRVDDSVAASATAGEGEPAAEATQHGADLEFAVIGRSGRHGASGETDEKQPLATVEES